MALDNEWRLGQFYFSPAAVKLGAIYLQHILLAFPNPSYFIFLLLPMQIVNAQCFQHGAQGDEQTGLGPDRG